MLLFVPCFVSRAAHVPRHGFVDAGCHMMVIILCSYLSVYTALSWVSRSMWVLSDGKYLFPDRSRYYNFGGVFHCLLPFR